MPIYRYNCGNCGKVDDYLVGRMGAFPDKCSGCDNCNPERFERVYAGAGFSVITRVERHSPDGHRHITIDRTGSGHLEDRALEPGLNVVHSNSPDGRKVTDILAVCEHGNASPILTAIGSSHITLRKI